METHLQEDGMFAFRCMDPENVAELRRKLERTGGTLFEWNGFMGDTSALAADARCRLSESLPMGFTENPAGVDDLKAMQAFLAEHGITPLSTGLMGGALCPTQFYVVKDKSGAIAAAGFTGMLQNRFSALADCAWMGLIAVDPACRGQGPGSRIVAQLLRASLKDLSARSVIAVAAPDNAASIAMLTGAGLAPKPEKSCVGVPGGGRPTR